MAEEPKKETRREKQRRAAYDHPDSKRRRGESKPETKGERPDGEAGGEEPPKEPKPEAEAGKEDVGAMMPEAHSAEHVDMHGRQEKERREQHGTHRDEHREMHKRHVAEIGAAKDHEHVMQVHRRHEGEHAEVHSRHMKAHADMHARHHDEMHSMHERHEKALGGEQDKGEAGKAEGRETADEKKAA
jgi:hypothetical protein